MTVTETMTTQPKVVTILAHCPLGWNEDPLNWDGNEALQIVKEKVLPKAYIQMYASVADGYVVNGNPVRYGLRDRFEDIEKRDLTSCIIQIIGHGRPGTLGLGYYWNNQYQGKNDGEYYALDSNPRAYWRLGAWRLPKDCEVWLIGCAVGQASKYDAAGDGDALMYDLANLFKRPVKAAAIEVRIQVDFDQKGLFTGKLLEAGKFAENAKILDQLRQEQRDILSPVAQPPKVLFVTGAASISNTPMDWSRFKIPVADLGLEFPNEIVAPEPALSLPDLQVVVELDGHQRTGQIYGNGRFLRVLYGDLPAHGMMRQFTRFPAIFKDTELQQRVSRALAEAAVSYWSDGHHPTE